MRQQGDSYLLPPGMLARFIQAACDEVGRDKLAQLLQQNRSLSSLLDAGGEELPQGEEAVAQYALLQLQLRQYYGRGARGILLRIGRNIWTQSVAQATPLEKAQLEVLRRLPMPARRRRILEYCAQLLHPDGRSTTVHLLDTDLLLVDRSSAAAWGQNSKAPLCSVTVGLLEAALFWATGRDADVEELACRAAGDLACEFRVNTGSG